MIRLALLLLMLSLTACAAPRYGTAPPTTVGLAATEYAFARSMQERNFEAFASFVADDAVFINGGAPLRGKAKILEHWRKFFQAATAPFSWLPEITEISVSQRLGYTEGPVRDQTNKVIATFHSTWALQPNGKWYIVFDNGYDVCACAK
ncbi:MAG: nuclear transport factor 2 family protein [Steroidobacteraceae bacterium]